MLTGQIKMEGSKPAQKGMIETALLRDAIANEPVLDSSGLINCYWQGSNE
jgi:hypothetical protein